MQPAVAAASAVDALKASVRGQVVLPEDPGYDDVRKIHNGMIDRRPAAIVRCTGTADVLACVRIARERGMPVSVRGGGHSVPGFCLCDGGLMIDLSAANAVRVDAARRTARAQGGATWGDFDHETAAHGLATTGGLMRTTGIGGLTLAGGHGLLMRKYGLACDNLLSADVVTADGRLLTASAEENADLFWGLRGGGGNFGIVTSFEYRLHPVTTVRGGLMLFPIAQARSVLKSYDEYMGTAPDELGIAAVLATLPNGAQGAGFVLAYHGDAQQGEQVVGTLRSFGTPIMDQVGVVPYTAVQSIAENFNPKGLRNYWKTSYLAQATDEAIDTMVEHHLRVPSPFTHQVLYSFGGAMARVGPDETAVSHRDAKHSFIMIGMWQDAARDAEQIAYVREVWSAMEKHTSGGFYPNYEADADPAQVKGAFGDAKYERLVALKRKYDPENFFRLNQNIRPE